MIYYKGGEILPYFYWANTFNKKKLNMKYIRLEKKEGEYGQLN